MRARVEVRGRAGGGGGGGGDGRETRIGGGSKTCDGAHRRVVLGGLLKRSAALKLGHFIVELRPFQRLFSGLRRRRVGGFLVGRWSKLRFGRSGLGSGIGSGSGAMIGAHRGPHIVVVEGFCSREEMGLMSCDGWPGTWRRRPCCRPRSSSSPLPAGLVTGMGWACSPGCQILVRVRLTLAAALPSLALTVTRPKCDSMTLM